MNSLCESLMVASFPPESVVVDKMAGDCAKKDTLRKLVSITCADDVVIAMFADMTVSDCTLVPEIVVKTDFVATLVGAMAESKCVNVVFFCPYVGSS